MPEEIVPTQEERNEQDRRWFELHAIRILESCEKPSDFVVFDELQQGKCQMPWCDGKGEGVPRRQNTAYHQEIRNWNCSCPPCQEELDLYWAEMWAEYRSSQGV